MLFFFSVLFMACYTQISRACVDPVCTQIPHAVPQNDRHLHFSEGLPEWVKRIEGDERRAEASTEAGHLTSRQFQFDTLFSSL